MTSVFLNGFLSSFVQIMAIGAQGSWVLECGLKKNKIYQVIAICSLCDIFLIILSIFGFGRILQNHTVIIKIFQLGGVVFLLWYGINSIRKAIKESHSISITNYNGKLIVMKTLAVSLLNPHAWVDTVVVIGGMSLDYLGCNKFIFFLGSIFASISWFLLLGYSAHKLALLFQKPITWKILDLVIGIGMLYLAYQLGFSG